MYVCVPCLCLVPVEARRGCQIHWNWSYRSLWAILYVLGTEPKSSGKASGHVSSYLFWERQRQRDMMACVEVRGQLSGIDSACWSWKWTWVIRKGLYTLSYIGSQGITALNSWFGVIQMPSNYYLNLCLKINLAVCSQIVFLFSL